MAPPPRRAGRSSIPARNGPRGSRHWRQRRDMAEGGTTITVERRHAMESFLAAQGWGGHAPTVLAGDASFRRYYRLTDGARRAVLMDAPPPQEDVLPYVVVA